MVEGQTEEQFSKSLLVPHLAAVGVWAKVLIVTTSRDRLTGRKAKGGGTWSSWKRDLRTLMGSDGGADVRFTTLFDLYGLPDDFPGVSLRLPAEKAADRALRLESEMSNALGDWRLIPYLQLHEFEAFVFVDLAQLGLLMDPQDRPQVEALATSVIGLAPEDINEGATTAPSKRLRGHLPVYEKTVHGALATEAIGLARIRGACPRFDRWLWILEAL